MMQLHPGGTLYERVGERNLRLLVERFYRRVALTEDLVELFPGHSDPSRWANTAERQFAFLSGFLGGPPLYHQQYGHPRLRARHLPFAVTPRRAALWLGCFRAALDETPELAGDAADELFAALTRVAAQMVNTPDGDPTPGAGLPLG